MGMLVISGHVTIQVIRSLGELQSETCHQTRHASARDYTVIQNLYLADGIQLPIPKLQIMNFILKIRCLSG